MFDFTINTHRKSAAYEVRAVIVSTNLRQDSKESQEELFAMRRKMEQVVPASFKPKFNLTHKDLIVGIKAESTSRAQTITVKLTEYIKEARKAVETQFQNKG